MPGGALWHVGTDLPGNKTNAVYPDGKNFTSEIDENPIAWTMKVRREISSVVIMAIETARFRWADYDVYRLLNEYPLRNRRLTLSEGGSKTLDDVLLHQSHDLIKFKADGISSVLGRAGHNKISYRCISHRKRSIRLNGMEVLQRFGGVSVDLLATVALFPNLDDKIRRIIMKDTCTAPTDTHHTSAIPPRDTDEKASATAAVHVATSFHQRVAILVGFVVQARCMLLIVLYSIVCCMLLFPTRAGVIVRDATNIQAWNSTGHSSKCTCFMVCTLHPLATILASLGWDPWGTSEHMDTNLCLLTLKP
ncbi:hypothetical protein Tco_1000141 [Tanacetum coccineum]